MYSCLAAGCGAGGGGAGGIAARPYGSATKSSRKSSNVLAIRRYYFVSLDAKMLRMKGKIPVDATAG